VARRKLDIHANITQDMVKQQYEFEPKPIGHGASGEGVSLVLDSLGQPFLQLSCICVHAA
jgi:hypothetical protein